jgi:hypothetical protein
MTVRRSTRAERRELVERLLTADHLLSDRAVARQAAVSHTHVADVRREMIAAGCLAERPCQAAAAVQADNGNGSGNLTRQPSGEPGPALRHGATSEIVLAPLRVRHLEELQAAFPSADATILRVQAGRLARFDALTEHLDRAGVRALMRRDGSLRPAATMLRQLEDAIERCHDRLSGAAAAGGADPYAEYRRIAGGKAAGG